MSSILIGRSRFQKSYPAASVFHILQKHLEMVLLGPDLVVLFSNSGPRETTKCHSSIDLRFPLKKSPDLSSLSRGSIPATSTICGDGYS